MRTYALCALVLCGAVSARADAALLLEEPFGSFGGYNPTGHAAVYLSRACAVTPIELRRCQPGETGVVVSRYHRVGGYDWIAVPLIPYLYAVEQAGEIPAWATEESVAQLRENYRRNHLSAIVPAPDDESTPAGEWIQLVGSSYDRNIFSYEIQTTPEQDDEVIAALNARDNRQHFNLFLFNCADFARYLLNLYYPQAIHRNLTADVGIMTPLQAARSLVRYGMRHPELGISREWIPQVPGTLPRSHAVRGVIESFVKSKKYMVPAGLLHPLVIGGLAVMYVAESRLGFRPKERWDAGILRHGPHGIAADIERRAMRLSP